MDASRGAVVTILPNLRSSHLEQWANSGAKLLYLGVLADLDPELLKRSNAQRLTVRNFVSLVRSPPLVLDIVEPLFARSWWPAFLLSQAIRVAARLQGRKLLVACYAIENLTVEAVLNPQRVHLPQSPKLAHLIAALWRWSSSKVDIVAFGSQMALDNYARAGICKNSQKRLIPHLLPECPCLHAHKISAKSTVLFLGEFTNRKGCHDLIAALEKVPKSTDRPQVVLIGTGDLPEKLLARVEALGATVMVKPPRDAVHAELRRARVLVLPSRRLRDWREQIGLPILEGLAHGCTVVATTETGLHDWLKKHGHEVVEPGDAEALSKSISRAFGNPLSPGAVLNSLPTRSGRIQSLLEMEEVARAMKVATSGEPRDR